MLVLTLKNNEYLDKTPDVFKDDKKTELLTKGKKNGIILDSDGVIYKGCERPHWREELPGF